MLMYDNDALLPGCKDESKTALARIMDQRGLTAASCTTVIESSRKMHGFVRSGWLRAAVGSHSVVDRNPCLV